MDKDARADFAQAVRLHQAGDPVHAIDLYRALLSRFPGDAKLAFALGAAQLQSGAVADSVATLTALTAAVPGWPEALNNLAAGLSALGRREALLDCYTRLCAVQPAAAVHRYRRGALLAEMGRPQDALDDFDRAISLAPAHGMAHFGRANALFKLGRTEDAVAACKRAADIRPDRADIAFALANMLVACGRETEALPVLDGLIARADADTETRMLRGKTLSALGRPEDALADFVRAAERTPALSEAQAKCAVTLFGLERYEESAAAFRRALETGGDDAGVYNGYGCALQKLGRFDEAISCFDRAVALKPDMADAYFNRSNASGARGNACVMADLRRALHYKPDFLQARANLSRLELLCGEYAEGWRDYEIRLQLPPQKDQVPPFPERSWRGETPVAGKTLLVLSEQGLGDVIQFCRYVPMAAALGGQVVFAVLPPLLSLMRTLRGGEGVVFCDMAKPLPPFDVFCPLLSLPLVFRTELSNIPAQLPYLFADDACRADWRRRLGAKSAPRIGLVWSGRGGMTFDPARSIPLAALAPILSLPYEFHCLQKDIRDPDRAAAAGWDRLHLHDRNLGDFADTAALAAEMDLVVSVDTSVLHLAGALGMPLFVLPRPGDWRWLQTCEDTPWYPGARLFRQDDGDGGWGPAIGRVAAALHARFGG